MSDGRASGVVLAIYPEIGLQPLAILRADQLYEDYQRRGFFRIGALPMLVAEGLSVELCDTNQLSAALTQASTRFGVKAKKFKAVEGRGFSLSFSGQLKGVVHARTARLESSTEWRLQEGTVEQPGSAAIAFRRATLAVAGPKAGELTYETATGPTSVHLLALIRPLDPAPIQP